MLKDNHSGAFGASTSLLYLSIDLKEALTQGEAFLGKPLENANYDELLEFMEKLKAEGLTNNSLSLRGHK